MLFASVADTAIVPMQDILGLDSRARMNFPGKAQGNWAWRYRAEQVDRRVTDRLAELTALYGRWNGPVPAGATRDRPPQRPRVRDRARAAAGARPPRRDRGPSDRPVNVGQEVLILVLELVMDGLDHVADRDDPDELVAGR